MSQKVLKSPMLSRSSRSTSSSMRRSGLSVADGFGKVFGVTEVDAGIIVEAGAKAEGGLKVDCAVAASGVESGGLLKFEQAANNRVNSKGSARFIALFVFYIHRVRVYNFILTVDNIHIAV